MATASARKKRTKAEQKAKLLKLAAKKPPVNAKAPIQMAPLPTPTAADSADNIIPFADAPSTSVPIAETEVEVKLAEPTVEPTTETAEVEVASAPVNTIPLRCLTVGSFFRLGTKVGYYLGIIGVDARVITQEDTSKATIWSSESYVEPLGHTAILKALAGPSIARQPKAKPMPTTSAARATSEPKATTPKAAPKAKAPGVRDSRLPDIGTTLVKEYKGTTYKVVMLADGFQVGTEVYPSLSKLAKVIRGNSGEVNGFAFFGLTK